MWPGENFNFTRKERNGIFIFFLLSILVIYGIPAIFISGKKNHNPVLAKFYDLSDTTGYAGIEGDTDFGIEHEYGEGRSYNDRKFRNNKRVKEKFLFDPNIVSKDSLLRLGFSVFAANNLVRYRENGGKIFSLEKFKSIYGVDTDLIDELKDYIKIEQTQKNSYEQDPLTQKQSNRIPAVQLHFIDVNTADTTDFMKLRGIGRYKATRIIDYREKLGGFLDINQLLEIPQVEDSLFYSIEAFLDADTSLIRKIDINTADFRTLIRHPYMNKDAVNLILNYRKQHGPFKHPREIIRIRAFKEDFVNKILPYLKTGETSSGKETEG